MHPSERVWLAVISVVLALMIATWIYGIYCYVQMVRHRRPGIPASSLLWPPEFLSERGRAFRRRALGSYALFAGLALLLVSLNYLVRP
jgi:multisubunit Na+/H+ antiporter MnhB subunit